MTNYYEAVPEDEQPKELKTLKNIKEKLDKEILKYKELIDKNRKIERREWVVLIGLVERFYKLSRAEAVKIAKSYKKDEEHYKKVGLPEREMYFKGRKDAELIAHNLTEEDLQENNN
jgi:hypothetical protein